MRRLDDKLPKLSAHVLPEAKAIVTEFISQAEGMGLVFEAYLDKPSRPNQMAVVNALFLWLDKLKRPEQIKALVEGFAMLDRCLQLDRPDGLRGAAPATEDITGDADIRDRDVTPPKKGKPRKKA